MPDPRVMSRKYLQEKEASLKGELPDSTIQSMKDAEAQRAALEKARREELHREAMDVMGDDAELDMLAQKLRSHLRAKKAASSAGEKGSLSNQDVSRAMNKDESLFRRVSRKYRKYERDLVD